MEFTRTEMLLGAEGMQRLSHARVAVFGIGGVGGHAVDALARSGIGALDLFDDDRIAESNINRQLIALHSTIGQHKVDAMQARIHDINPNCIVQAHRCFFMPETADQFDFSQYDYVIDAIDTVTAKIELVMRCQAVGTPIICAMGAGNKLDPTAFQVADIYRTQGCPLARVMRRELKKRGVKRLKVVYSQEEARVPQGSPQETMPETPERSGTPKRTTPGSTAFVPSVVGLILASVVVRDLSEVDKTS